MDKNTQNKISADSDLIESLGGAAALANRLGFSVQRVYNWTMRGIPKYVKWDNPDIFKSQNNSEAA